MRHALESLDIGMHHEWRTDNSIGGYAASSVVCANTRRSHGLLAAALSGAGGATILLAKLEDEVRVEDQIYLLSTNQYPSIVHPQGYQHLVAFQTCPHPTFTYAMHDGTLILQKRISMPADRNEVHIEYCLLHSPESIRLGLVPLMACRGSDERQQRQDGFPLSARPLPEGRLAFQASAAMPTILLGVQPEFQFTDHSGWFFNFTLLRERELGRDDTEDLYSPGRWDGMLAVGGSVAFVAAVEQEIRG